MNNFKIGIAGCLGRMGKELVISILQNKQTTFVGGFENKNHSQVGEKFSKIFKYLTAIKFVNLLCFKLNSFNVQNKSRDLYGRSMLT